MTCIQFGTDEDFELRAASGEVNSQMRFRMNEEYLLAEQYAPLRGRLANFESHSTSL
jgi:hypothetical protein